jgi:hypothetical protein
MKALALLDHLARFLAGVIGTLAGLWIGAMIWLVALWLIANALGVLPAHAAGNAPGPSDPPGAPVVAVAEVLATIRPGDDMGAILALFEITGVDLISPHYPSLANRRCDVSPCCVGCTTDPIPPAPVPLPGTLLLLTAAIAALIWKVKRT